MRYLLRIYIRLLHMLGSYKLFIILLISLISMVLGKYFYLDPKFRVSEKEKIDLTVARIVAKKSLTAEKIITLLDSLTKIHNPQLWIHSFEFSDGKIKMLVRGLNPKAINYYLYNVEEANHLAIETLNLRNKNYNLQQNAGQQEEKAIPYALKMFLERNRKNTVNNAGQLASSQANFYNNILYYYEAEVVFTQSKNS